MELHVVFHWDSYGAHPQKPALPLRDNSLHSQCALKKDGAKEKKLIQLTDRLGYIIQLLLRAADQHDGEPSAGELTQTQKRCVNKRRGPTTMHRDGSTTHSLRSFAP